MPNAKIKFFAIERAKYDDQVIQANIGYLMSDGETIYQRLKLAGPGVSEKQQQRNSYELALLLKHGERSLPVRVSTNDRGYQEVDYDRDFRDEGAAAGSSEDGF